MTPAEKLMLRAWLDEIDKVCDPSDPADSSDGAAAATAARTGTTPGRVLDLVRHTPYDEREACRA